jgi:hydroxymethylbilane synthase
MLPAAAQGAIGLEIRLEDERAHRLCAALNDARSAVAVTAERALLAALDGSCRTPIAALATLHGPDLLLDALVARQDGSELVRLQGRAPQVEAARLGADIGHQLRARMPADFFADLGG